MFKTVYFICSGDNNWIGWLWVNYRINDRRDDIIDDIGHQMGSGGCDGYGEHGQERQKQKPVFILSTRLPLSVRTCHEKLNFVIKNDIIFTKSQLLLCLAQSTDTGE
jgi:hypothetical protein